jgi:hypothetical protein
VVSFTTTPLSSAIRKKKFIGLSITQEVRWTPHLMWAVKSLALEEASGQLHYPAALPPGKRSPYPVNGRLGEDDFREV